MAKTFTHRDWYNLLNAEVRRQTRNAKLPERQHSMLPLLYVPAVRSVPVQATQHPTMSLPPCLCRPDSEAGQAMRLSREFWLRTVVCRVPVIKQTRYGHLFAR